MTTTSGPKTASINHPLSLDGPWSDDWGPLLEEVHWDFLYGSPNQSGPACNGCVFKTSNEINDTFDMSRFGLRPTTKKFRIIFNNNRHYYIS